MSPDLDAAEAALAAGDPRLALGHLAALHAHDPAGTDHFDAAIRALMAMGAQEVPPEATDLLRAMILQEPAPGHPRILHHKIARMSNTRRNTRNARPIVAALMPLINALVQDRAPRTGAVLLLVVVRGMLPASGPSQKVISRLHLAQFADFTAPDLALPYSVMFRARRFGLNRDDLLRRYPNAQAALVPEAGLSLCHLLLLDRLGLGPLFPVDAEDAVAAAIMPRLARAGSDPDEGRAARSLVMRYVRRGDVAAVDRLRQAGLPPALLETATRWPRLDDRAVVRRPSLDGRVSRYLAAGSNAVAIAAPALARPGRKARVALCVSGQLRGFERAFETWKRALLPFAEFDIYVHTWARVGRAIPNSGRAALPFEGELFRREWWRISAQVGRKQLQARQPHLMAALEVGNTTDAARVQAVYDAVDVVVDDETDPGLERLSNQAKMHYKIHAASSLAERSGRSYDLVMRLRPDLPMKLPMFRWSKLRQLCEARPVIFADLEFGINFEWLMIGDMMAIGAPGPMAAYSSAWTTYGSLAELDLLGVPGHFVSHIPLAQCCWYSGVDVRRLPVSRGALMDLPPISTAAIRAALAKDAEGRDDPIDRALAAAAREG